MSDDSGVKLCPHVADAHIANPLSSPGWGQRPVSVLYCMLPLVSIHTGADSTSNPHNGLLQQLVHVSHVGTCDCHCEYVNKIMILLAQMCLSVNL